MTGLATRSSDLPAKLVMPEMSDALQLMCRDIMGWEGRAEPSYSAKMQGQARDALTRLTAIQRPPTRDHLRAWLAPILAAVRNPKSAEEVAAWFLAILKMCADVPASAFNEKTQQYALKTITYHPSAADIWAVIADDVNRLGRLGEALEKIVTAPTRDAT